MRRIASLLLVVFLIFLLSSCFKQLNVSVEFENLQTEYATKNVTVSWKPTGGVDHLYLYSIDGDGYVETSETELELTNLEEGQHTVEVKIAGSTRIPDKFTFIVDTEGPLVRFMGSDRYSYGLFSEDFTPFGRYVFLKWEFSEEISKVEFRFVDTNSEEFQYITDWLEWNPASTSMLISDEGLTANLKEGNTVLDVFEVGKIYRMYIRAYDKLGNTRYSDQYRPFVVFRLDERYVDEDKPLVYLEPGQILPAEGENRGSIEVAIVASNVAKYVESVKEYFAPDNTRNGELMYLQFSVVHDEGLVFEEAFFPQFIENKTSFDGVIPSNREAVVVRGFIDEAPLIPAVSDIVAILRFSFPQELSGENVSFKIGSRHKDALSGPMYFIRDEANRVIDGITVDNQFVEVSLPELVAAGM